MSERIRLGDLIEDLAIYPRGSVSDVRVADIGYAMDAGREFPPLVADRQTMKIVDGFHRRRALIRRLGEDGEADVDLTDLADEGAMLIESARLNSAHGLPLGRHDQMVIHIKAVKLGVSDEDIASALGVTPARLLRIAIREATGPDGGKVATKGGMGHLGGSYLSAEQLAEVRRQRGGSARSKVAELTGLLRQGLAPMAHDPDLRLALAELGSVIKESLASFTA